MSQAARIAHRIHIDDPEILAESYRIYGQKFLQKPSTSILTESGANFVDASLVQELEKEGFFQKSK
jgi:ribosomal protein S19E (S16A)